jgi:aminopeptidase N
MRRAILRDDPGSVSDAPDFFLAHELAHQWWGHGLAGENYHERWLSEGAAQYAAALWIRRSRGEEAFREVLERMGHWALDRTTEGPISLGYRLGHVKGDAQVFRAVVYDKGAYVLHMLRAVVGDEPFRLGLVALQSERRYSKVGTDDLREAIERASGRDLSAYFREWVRGTRLPRLRFASHEQVSTEGGPAAVVDVLAEDLPGPVPLAIRVSVGRNRQNAQVDLQPGPNRFVIATPTRPGKVELNLDRGLLATIEKR